MNSLPRRTFLGLSLGFAAASLDSFAHATPPAGAEPAPAKEELFKFKKVEINQQKTPDYSVKGTTDKRWKAKEWLEVEFEIDVNAPKGSTKDFKFFDKINVKYYVFLIPADAKKQKVLVADIGYVNVPVGETIGGVVYLSNATIANITGDKLVDKGLIKFYGAEVTYNGTLVGQIASAKPGGQVWWKSASLPPVEEGLLLPKSKTPFAPLWFDHFMEEKADLK